MWVFRLMRETLTCVCISQFKVSVLKKITLNNNYSQNNYSIIYYTIKLINIRRAWPMMPEIRKVVPQVNPGQTLRHRHTERTVETMVLTYYLQCQEGGAGWE